VTPEYDPQSPGAIARRVVDAIVSDLTGRVGLGGEWDAIDDDTHEEITSEWRDIVTSELMSGDDRSRQ
jgi:hypothetical protein